ncbi:ABC transporter ATP-binding protein [Sphingomonas sp. HF-S3]|uniref:ABC transporter ATP-binding protein n=1 Tax=Sphingomonas rustica TaxID=3103142 RepID=A0ABV0B4D0_9SPHN
MEGQVETERGADLVRGNAAKVPKATRQALIARLLSHISPARRRDVAGVSLLLLVGAAAEVMVVGAIIPFLDVMTGGQQAWMFPGAARCLANLAENTGVDTATVAGLILIAVAILAAGARLVVAWRLHKLAFDIGHDLSTSAYGHILARPYSYHVASNSGELILAIFDVQLVVMNVLLPAMQALSSLVVATLIVCFLVAIDPAIALLSSGFVVAAYLMIALWARPRLRAGSAVVTAAQSERMLLLREGIGGIRDVILGAFQPSFERAYAKTEERLREKRRESVFLNAAPRYLIEAGAVILIAIIALALANRPGGLIEALPMLAAMAVGAQRLVPMAQQLYSGVALFSANAHQLTRVLNLFDGEDDISLAQRCAEPLPFRYAITLTGVSFRYPGRPDDALHSVDLEIVRGIRLGITGASGSGKSTLIDIVMGLLTPTSGEIRIDGAPLGRVNARNWQSRIGHVPQTIFLLDGTIAANIAFGVEPGAIDPDKVQAAARGAMLEPFIMSLPERFETRIGENGVRLSGGQRQRIGIARALYANTSLLVLDEITSSLDDETEMNVVETIRSLPRSITIIMISHRKACLDICDRTIHLSHGTLLPRKTV